MLRTRFKSKMMALLKTLLGLALFSVALADFRVKFNVETTAEAGYFVIKVRGRG